MDMEIELADLKESAVRRLLRTVISQESKRSRMAGKRTKVEIEDSEEDGEDDDDMESEMEKNASLAMEKKGSPAPINASESDFSKGIVRRALKRMPKSARTKKA